MSQQPTPSQKKHRELLSTLYSIAFVFLIVVALNNCSGPSSSTASTPTGVGNHLSPTPTSKSPSPTPTPTPKPPSPTPTSKSPSPTPTPKPPSPTPTPTPIPNIVGSYDGSFTTDGQSCPSAMQIQIYQSGQKLTGTTTEGNATYSDAGTITSNGNFTITEDGTITLYGSITSSGHLSGTWNTTSGSGGTWDVSFIPNIAGCYSGSFTTDGQPGTGPMKIEIHQSGQNLTGTTIEISATYSDAGTITSNGNFTITEDGTINLYGSIVGSGHLSGTWNTTSGSSGTWDVSLT